jgi:hypothetical protein
MTAPAWTDFAQLHLATGESPTSLLWLANRGQYCRHYHQKWVPKRHGRRLLEAPLSRLKRVQRILLKQALESLPLHEAAMGFRKGRGVLDHARRHVGRRWVVSMDLCDFFASIGSRRIGGTFRSLGYPDEVARVMAELVTNAATLTGSSTREERLLYARRHLPQGAPTSPAIANLVARCLDQRLDALARSIGGSYSRYADDIVISCDQFCGWLVPIIGGIAMDEGFRVRFRKTRVMSASRRQMITGLVVNQSPGVSRTARERLEAILYNCVKHGPASQDRNALGDEFEAHLRGRVAYVRQMDPAQAAKLTALLAKVDWER